MRGLNSNNDGIWACQQNSIILGVSDRAPSVQAVSEHFLISDLALNSPVMKSKIVTTQEVRWPPMQMLFGLITQSPLGRLRDEPEERLHRRLQVKLSFIHPSVFQRTKRDHAKAQQKSERHYLRRNLQSLERAFLKSRPVQNSFGPFTSIHEHSREPTSIPKEIKHHRGEWRENFHQYCK